MKRIYLCIPYTGMEALSFKIANIKAGELMQAGNLVFSPISHSHPIALQCKLPGEHAYWRAWNRSFIEAWADELYVITEYNRNILPWLESTGVQYEIELADQLGKPVVLVGAE